MSRRFMLTYQREGQSIEIEGVQFSNKTIVLEFYPLSDSDGTREFYDIGVMEFVLNEFAETSIKWIDEEVTADE